MRAHRISKYNHIMQTVVDHEHQKEIYGVKYNEKYNAPMYDNHLSLLRLGFVAGTLGKYPSSILDVGYGNGDFLAECVKKIDKCYGYDISDFDPPAGVIRIPNIIKQPVEVVTFWDSLEHIEDIEIIKDIDCEYCIISCPMSHYFKFAYPTQAREWFETHRHYRPDEHLHYFDEISLNSFMDDMGYACVVRNIDLEDLIRKPADDLQNILTAVYKKRT